MSDFFFFFFSSSDSPSVKNPVHQSVSEKSNNNMQALGNKVMFQFPNNIEKILETFVLTLCNEVQDLIEC